VEVGGAEGEHEPFARKGEVLDKLNKRSGGGERVYNHIYGPGRSFIALKQRHVSSTRTGPCT
jgi:hypothetical protein